MAVHFSLHPTLREPCLWVVAAADITKYENISSNYQNNSKNGNNSSCYQFCPNLVDSSHTPVFFCTLNFQCFWWPWCHVVLLELGLARLRLSFCSLAIIGGLKRSQATGLAAPIQEKWLSSWPAGHSLPKKEYSRFWQHALHFWHPNPQRHPQSA